MSFLEKPQPVKNHVKELKVGPAHNVVKSGETYTLTTLADKWLHKRAVVLICSRDHLFFNLYNEMAKGERLRGKCGYQKDRTKRFWIEVKDPRFCKVYLKHPGDKDFEKKIDDYYAVGEPLAVHFDDNTENSKRINDFLREQDAQCKLQAEAADRANDTDAMELARYSPKRDVLLYSTVATNVLTINFIKECSNKKRLKVFVKRAVDLNKQDLEADKVVAACVKHDVPCYVNVPVEFGPYDLIGPPDPKKRWFERVYDSQCVYFVKKAENGA